MCARASRPTFGLHPEGGTELKQTLAITAAVVVLVALTATGALYGLNALAGSHQTCGKVNPSELRHPADPDFARKLEQLARCER